MLLEFTNREIQLVMRLVDGALEGINQEIRHCATYRYRDAVRAEREALRNLQSRLNSVTQTGSLQIDEVIGGE